MSLKAQLRISIVTMMTMLVLMQCVATLRFTIEDKFTEVQDRAEAIKEQTRIQVQKLINDRLAAQKPAPTSFEETKALVHKFIASDVNLPEMFNDSIVTSRGVAEIQLCDDAGLILNSSSRLRSRMTYLPLPLFEEWRMRPIWGRIWEVLNDTRDYAMVVTLAFSKDSTKRILDIRVVVSSALIRDRIKQQVKTLAAFSALSLLAAMVFAYLFSNVLLRWLNRLSQRIESITTGQFTPPDRAQITREPKEFADMTSKLEVLSQQFRGAREDMVQMRSNIDGMLERLEEGVLLFGPDSRVVRASRSIERILGLGQRQLVGKLIDDLFPASTPLGEVLRAAIDSGRPVRELPVTIERVGAPLRLLANVDLIEGPDRRSSLLLNLRDVETRRQLRTQLDISTRLAAISRLTGGVAHEIKNPLNAMALHLEVLKEKLSGEARVENEIGVIGGEIARLDRVVKTFLDFTRPVDLELKRVDLVALAEQVSKLVRPDADMRGISVVLEAEVPQAYLRADEDLIKQALLNVVNNGVEAMSGGGRLLIRLEMEGDYVVVLISDTGPGIPAALRERIFNLYFTTKEKGSGIGLALTFRIIQLHNGTVDFSTEEGVGTTFRLQFPVSDDIADDERKETVRSGTMNGTALAEGSAEESIAAAREGARR